MKFILGGRSYLERAESRVWYVETFDSLEVYVVYDDRVILSVLVELLFETF